MIQENGGIFAKTAPRRELISTPTNFLMDEENDDPFDDPVFVMPVPRSIAILLVLVSA